MRLIAVTIRVNTAQLLQSYPHTHPIKLLGMPIYNAEWAGSRSTNKGVSSLYGVRRSKALIRARISTSVVTAVQ